MQNKNLNIIIGAHLRFSGSVGYNCFQTGCVYVEYDLFNTTISIQSCIYMNFCINLTQFYINFSRQEPQVELAG